MNMKSMFLKSSFFIQIIKILEIKQFYQLLVSKRPISKIITRKNVIARTTPDRHPVQTLIRNVIDMDS